MSLSTKELTQNPNFFPEILDYTREILSTYDRNQHVCSVFASQQRWLMALAGFALYCGGIDGEPPGIHANRFANYIVEHEIASHNTALSFIQEMLALDFLRYLPIANDRRARPMQPTEEAAKQLALWLSIHLSVLDRLDGGKRNASFGKKPELIALMQPTISVGIIESDELRNPGETFDLFTWANSGGIIMDYLISRIGTINTTTKKAIIGPVAFTDICNRFLISRTNAKRLMNKAIKMQSVGWMGSPGRSQLWLSSAFVEEYCNYQAGKLAIIDAAWQNTLGTRPIRMPSAKQNFTSAAPSR
ncbi:MULTISPECIES: hypothetical protein [Rhizobium]|uniref:DUF3987 domain-containing protein n=2 Tax=Rhizobium tropici TaxID=398 RepID=A0ABR6R4L4_RHITR|nr:MULTISPECIES: hypothetical protein [Rhizobium]AGB71867.1 hypothetical protein RTCIAT899_CH12440 [Rhizobium tropici CIAT 899]MBB4243763.1 hypothetical protein [Rhizobium tropici]MBB5593262.1 hypothetical protein [Rhizobium tropici]MBB6494103.1 hypothetical protein [Rhizobium tropici]